MFFTLQPTKSNTQIYVFFKLENSQVSITDKLVGLVVCLSGKRLLFFENLIEHTFLFCSDILSKNLFVEKLYICKPKNSSVLYQVSLFFLLNSLKSPSPEIFH